MSCPRVYTIRPMDGTDDWILIMSLHITCPGSDRTLDRRTMRSGKSEYGIAMAIGYVHMHGEEEEEMRGKETEEVQSEVSDRQTGMRRNRKSEDEGV